MESAYNSTVPPVGDRAGITLRYAGKRQTSCLQEAKEGLTHHCSIFNVPAESPAYPGSGAQSRQAQAVEETTSEFGGQEQSSLQAQPRASVGTKLQYLGHFSKWRLSASVSGAEPLSGDEAATGATQPCRWAAVVLQDRLTSPRTSCPRGAPCVSSLLRPWRGTAETCSAG